MKTKIRGAMLRLAYFLFLLVVLATSACATPAAQTPAPTTAPSILPVGPTHTATPAEETNSEEGSLTGTTWMWSSFTSPVEQYEVENPENYTVDFQEDGTVNIKADCNNASGTYTVDGKSITITLGPMTMAACPPESKSDDFVKYLDSAAIYFFQDADLYIDLKVDSGTMQFSSSASNSGTTGNDPLAAMSVDLNAEPFSGTLYLGGGEEKWLNPTLISALGGTSEGSGVDASSLGAGCDFFIPTRPDVVVNWEQQDDVEKLRFFFLSMGDPGLALVTPSGKVLCSDDLNPLVLDPYIEVENPEPGTYTAFLGSYEGDAVYPGFLVVTSQDLNPSNMDLTQLFPRNIDPRGVPQVLPLDLLKLDSLAAAKQEGGELSDSSLPYTADFTAGGEIGAFNLDQPNELCTGFISAVPTSSFEWTGNSDPLVMFFESNVDTTLVVRAPDGSFICDDDSEGSANINPSLTLTPQTGKYHIWVGSFSPDIQADGTLTISNDSAAVPAPLTSKDIQQ